MSGDQPRPRVDYLYFRVRSFGMAQLRKINIDPKAPNFLRDDGPLEVLAVETDDFNVVINEGRAEVDMLTSYSTVDEARSLVEPYLRAWEIEAYLNHFKKHVDTQFPIRFEFDGADISNPDTGTS